MLPREIYKGSPFSVELSVTVNVNSNYSIRFNGSTRKTFEIDISSGNAVLNLSVDDLAGLTDGQHRWFLYESANSKPAIINSGYLWIRPSPLDEEGADVLTHAERMLAAIEKRLEGRILSDHENYAIDGRQLQRIPMAELEKLRRRYQWEVYDIQVAKGLRRPIKPARLI